MAAVTVDDVWQPLPTIVHRASERYGAQTILIGKLTQDPNTQHWQGSWSLLSHEDKPSWQVQGNSLNAILAQGISQSTEYLKPMQQPKVAAITKSKPFLIAVEGIESSADFSEIQQYLKKVEPILDLNIYELTGNVAVFEITTAQNNGAQQLQQALSLDKHFIPVPQLNQGLASIEAMYRWTGHAQETGTALNSDIAQQPSESFAAGVTNGLSVPSESDDVIED
jgi:hypothetical protein